MRGFLIRFPDRKTKTIKSDNKNEIILGLILKWENHCNENWIKFGKKNLIMKDSEDLIKSFLERCGTYLLNTDMNEYRSNKRIFKNEMSSGDSTTTFEQIYKPQQTIYKKSLRFQTDLSRILELEKQGYKIAWCIVDRYNKFSFSGKHFCIWNNTEYAKQEIKVKKEIHDFFSMDKILIAYKESVILEEMNIGKHIVKKHIRIPDKSTFRFFDQNIHEITANIIE